MHSTRATQVWSRRRATIILTILLCVGGVIAWRVTHRQDPRLVGTWKATRDPDNGLSDQWGFRPDGSGWRKSEFAFDITPPQFMELNHRWWTSGERLFIRWAPGPADGTGFQKTLAELYDALRGRRIKQPLDEYTFTVQGDGSIRVQPKKGPWNQEQAAIYLTRSSGN